MMSAQIAQRELRRSRRNRMIAGVCGGLGEYFGIDPVWVRLVFVILIFANGLGLILYPILWWIMPEEPVKTGEMAVGSSSGKRVMGTVLVGLGTVFLLQNLGLIRVDFDLVWPVLLIVAGLYLLFSGSANQHPHGHEEEKQGKEAGEGPDGQGVGDYPSQPGPQE